MAKRYPNTLTTNSTKKLPKAHSSRAPRTAMHDQISSILGTSMFAGGRRIYLFGEITDEASYRFLIALHALDASEGDITIYLSSGGGATDAGMAIYDAICFAQNTIKIIAIGRVMSIAAMILQAGDERYMMPECRYMVHNGEIDFSGGVDGDKIVQIAKEQSFMNNRYAEILAERSGQTLQKMVAAVAKETYYSATQCVELGFADGVLTTGNRND